MIASTRTVPVCGQPVRVNIRPGTDDRPPLLLCNGIGASLEVLQPLVDALDPSRAVIRFDVPGAGGSTTPVLPYRFSGMALLLSRLLDRLGHPQVDILGFSWGGGLAQQFAVQHRKRCRRVVLACTSTGVLTIPGHPRSLSKMLTTRRYRDPEYAASIAAMLYGGTMRTGPEQARQVLGDHTRTGSTRGYLYQLAAGIGWTSLPFLPLIRQPALLLFGDDDPIIRLRNGSVMNTLMPRADLHVFHGGHLGLLTEADQLAPVIDTFLDRPQKS